jgi:hypothetical protein
MRCAPLAVFALLAAGCAGGGKAAPSTPTGWRLTPKARFAAAKPEVTKYLQALAMDKPLVAQQLAGSDGCRLRRAVAVGPSGHGSGGCRSAGCTPATLYKVKQPGAVGVLVKMRARSRRSRWSQWVELGRRMIIAAHAREGWR